MDVAEHNVTEAEPGTPPALPHGTLPANWFQGLNALSWQVTLGAPAYLYAKSLGASATVIGVMAALTPLLTVTQLPATKLLPRYGYRRFLLAGWGSRTVAIFLLAGVPLMRFAPAGVKLGGVVGLLFVYNFLRGIASGAWWPWMSELVPPGLRGRFLARDQVAQQLGALVSLSVAAAVLGGGGRDWQFAVLFLISALAQAASLVFLYRVPDVNAPEKLKASGHRVPWAEMCTWRPFLRLLILTLLYQSVNSGLLGFTTAYLRGRREGLSDSVILVLTAVSFVGALGTVPFLGRVLDVRGSLPVLRGCLVTYLVILAGWWGIAGHLIGGPVVWVVALLSLATGMASANFLVANNRLTMQTVPVMGRNHFFAAYVVITSLGTGVAPIAWGRLLDRLRHVNRTTGGVSWNHYSIYFAATFVVVAVALAYSARVKEGTAGRG